MFEFKSRFLKKAGDGSGLLNTETQEFIPCVFHQHSSIEYLARKSSGLPMGESIYNHNWVRVAKDRHGLGFDGIDLNRQLRGIQKFLHNHPEYYECYINLWDDGPDWDEGVEKSEENAVYGFSVGNFDYDKLLKTKKLNKVARLPYKTKEFNGFTILIGRSAADNDILSMEIAQPNDWWLHTSDAPGSHIVVRNPENLAELPPEVLQEAAKTAVDNSRAKGQAGVDVVVGRAGDLSKPKDVAIGEIEISQFKTIKA